MFDGQSWDDLIRDVTEIKREFVWPPTPESFTIETTRDNGENLLSKVFTIYQRHPASAPAQRKQTLALEFLEDESLSEPIRQQLISYLEADARDRKIAAAQ